MRIYADEQTPLLEHYRLTENLKLYRSLIRNINSKIACLKNVAQDLIAAKKSYASYRSDVVTAKKITRTGKECVRLSQTINRLHQNVCVDIDSLKDFCNDSARQFLNQVQAILADLKENGFQQTQTASPSFEI